MRYLGLCFLFLHQVLSFVPHYTANRINRISVNGASEDASAPEKLAPQAWNVGSSTQSDLSLALLEAFELAIKGIPGSKVDLCMVFVSSLYDAGVHPPATTILPTLRQAAEANDIQLDNIIGTSVAGIVTSSPSPDSSQLLQSMEFEGLPCVSIFAGVLPDVNVQTFGMEEIPDPFMDPEEWQKCVGVKLSENSTMMILPTPAMATELDDLQQALQSSKVPLVGGVASTVSSLSRAKLYCSNPQYDECTSNGLVGVVLTGDIEVQSLRADGAKPVGGVYRVVQGSESTIQAIVLDEDATEALDDDEVPTTDDDEEDDGEKDPQQARQQAYAKAIIPKPVLAEANFLMKFLLTDDDQAFMRQQLLIGLERTSRTMTAANALQEPQYTVYPVASGGMKDGSVTFALGSVRIEPGMRLRFFVRNADYAAYQVEQLWVDYKRNALEEQFDGNSTKFTPAACLVTPTLDRGQTFFGKPHLESSAVARMLPTLPCIGGFFCNGVIGNQYETLVQGSASAYVLIGPRNPERPIYTQSMEEEEDSDNDETDGTPEDSQRTPVTFSKAAPRSPDGELVLRRREVHAGRALTVSTVEWSVAEKTATPTSALEEFMWEKETQVDRWRERVPLANLVSQCRLAQVNPESPKPRSWTSTFDKKKFTIIPECKRVEPVGGSLYPRYDLAKLAKEFTMCAPAISVNCDPIFFGGDLEDIRTVREASEKAALAGDDLTPPPILASDLILYPYQLYKLRLVGADAVNIIAGALEEKDMLYLTKIASSLQIESLVTVTSTVQLAALSKLPSLDGVIVSNRNLEDFSHDMTGEQAIDLLQSTELEALREEHPDLLVLAEGRLGIVDNEDGDGSPEKYLQKLKKAGAHGGILGGGLTLQGMSYSEVQELANSL